MVKYLTNKDFEDYEGKKYKRRFINPDNFEILDTYPKQYDLFDSDDETDNFTCLCSENACNQLFIIGINLLIFIWPLVAFVILGSMKKMQ